MKTFAHVILLLGTLVVAQAQGTYEGLLNYTTSGSSGAVANTAGWSFTPQISLELTDLGCLDYVVTPQGPVDIGLWTSAGTLLMATNIHATDPLINATRYVSITPIFLNAGTSYRLGIYTSSGLFLDPVGPGIGGSATVSSDISLDGSALASSSGFVFPDGTGAPGTMVLGPNFRYDRVPEPSTSVLLGLAGLLVGFLKRSRARS